MTTQKERENMAHSLTKRVMPKEMSDWLEIGAIADSISISRTVDGITNEGYIMKSKECAVIFLPQWNCNKQVADLIKLFEKKKTTPSNQPYR